MDFKKELENYTFNDLFDIDEVQKLQDAFSDATGVAAIITEPDGTPITNPSGFSFFCKNIIRKTEKGLNKCILSDSLIQTPKNEGPIVQRCLSAGLLGAGASIMIGGRHIANYLIGQVMITDDNPDMILKYSDEIGADRNEFEEALKQVTKMTKLQFEKTAQFLYLNARYLSDLAYNNVMQKVEIQNRKNIEEQLSTEKELFKITIESIVDGVITTDIYGIITSINKIASALTGWKNDEAVGLPFDEVFKINYQSPVLNILESKESVTLEKHTVLTSKNGEKFIIDDSGSPIKNEKGELLGTVIVFRDVTKEQEHQEEIEYLSMYDSLTGLYNRNSFEKELSLSQTDREIPITVVMGDVNGLKITNDVFGHAKGDQLLKEISEILRSCCRPGDIIARLGGDEFAILMPRTTYEEANAVCNKIKEKCKNHKNNTIIPSIALGIDTKESLSQDILSVMKSAEDRMYRNKLFESKSKKSSTLLLLKKVLYEKSGETEEHSNRLIELSEKMGRALKLNENEINDLKLTAGLHDIGLVAIPEVILNKPGSLNEEEWEEVKRHPEIGYRIALSAVEFSHISEYILCHHERWDGKGYPQGRKGESTPLLSRIIALADSYDVMIHDQPYKPKVSKKEALEEISRCSGTQFDPKLANLIISLFE